MCRTVAVNERGANVQRTGRFDRCEVQAICVMITCWETTAVHPNRCSHRYHPRQNRTLSLRVVLRTYCLWGEQRRNCDTHRMREARLFILTDPIYRKVVHPKVLELRMTLK